MIVKITSLEREVRDTKSGDKPGLLVVGMKKGYQGAADEEWEKFLFEWANADQIDALEKIGVGGTADIKMEKQGKFWNIVGVQPYTPGGAGKTKDKAPAKEKAKASEPVQDTPAPRQVVVADGISVESIRSMALEQAINVETALLVNSEKLGKKGKFSPELVDQDILARAESFASFIKGSSAAKIESSTKDLEQPEGAEPVIPEDDIPF